MPRTKLTKIAASKKRSLNFVELEDILRDFDVEFDNALQALRNAHQKNLEDVDKEIDSLKSEIPEILQMTMGELKKASSLAPEKNNVNKTMTDFNMTLKEMQHKSDEGYLTADVGYKTSDSDCDKMSQKGKISTIAPLKSLKSRRRSQSVSSLTSTPGPRMMMSQIKLKTPMHMASTGSTHASRSKFRTPAQKMASQRAASADRVDAIIPKINPMTPVSILRHPRSGEVAFSVTGSPIVTTSVIEHTANVNIPVSNGILSVRPESIDPSHLNASLIRKIDSGTIAHLKTLKDNLDMLMKAYENRMG